jgi:hypothetical protein
LQNYFNYKKVLLFLFGIVTIMSQRLIQYLQNLPDDEFKKRYLTKGFFSDVKLSYDAKIEIDNYVENRAKQMVIKHDTDESRNAEL